MTQVVLPQPYGPHTHTVPSNGADDFGFFVIKRSMDIADELVGMALENKWLRIFIAGYVSSNMVIIGLLTFLVLKK